jgi:hypothetical protein
VIGLIFRKKTKSNGIICLSDKSSNNHEERHPLYALFIVLMAVAAIALGTANWSIVTAQNETSTDQSTAQLIEASIQSWMAVALGIGALIGVILKFIETYRKNHTNDKRFDKLAEVLELAKNSIEESDKAIKDNADLNKLIINNVANVPQIREWFERPENKTMIEQANKNADQMAEDLRNYYQVLSKQPGDEDKDSIVRRLATTQKQLVPG